MLVFNEVKVYRDFLGDADFAMIKDNYTAHVYSPLGEMGGFHKPLDYTSITKKKMSLNGMQLEIHLDVN